VVAVWAGLVLGLYVLDRARGVHAPACIFRRLAGVPCPTCGGTRAAAALARGDAFGAVAQNPLVTVGLVLLALWLGGRLLLGRTVSLKPAERRLALVLALALLAGNWAYVVMRGG
jgi:hypothetical protein